MQGMLGSAEGFGLTNTAAWLFKLCSVPKAKLITALKVTVQTGTTTWLRYHENFFPHNLNFHYPKIPILTKTTDENRGSADGTPASSLLPGHLSHTVLLNAPSCSALLAL